MAATTRRRRSSARRTNRPKRRPVRNFYPGLVNPRRKRRNRPRRNHGMGLMGNPRRRRNPSWRRHNPPSTSFAGFDLKEIAIAGAAVVLEPFAEKQFLALLPASMSGTTAGRWAVKIGTTIAVGYAAKKFVSPRAGQLAMIALGAQLIADAVAEFAPTLSVSTTSAYVRRDPAGARGLGAFPIAGARSRAALPGPGGSSGGAARRLFTPTDTNTVERLNPAYRF